MKRIVALLVLVAVGAFAVAQREPMRAAQPMPPNKVAPFMRIKLEHANRVLEGIAVADFPMIAKNAEKLSLLSRESNWAVLQTMEYVEHSVNFRKATDAIMRAAQEKNLDGAALGYVDMTMRCVACHKYVRDVRMASVPLQVPAVGD